MSEQIVPQHTDEVVLYRDEDQRELARMARALDAAAHKSAMPLRLGDDEVVVELAREYDAFKQQAAERGIKVLVKHMPGRRWRRLVAEHPPRVDHDGDEAWGFNHLTLADDVVAPCVASIGGMELVGEALEAELDKMSDGDFSKVYAAVLRANTGQGPDPKESISAQLRRTSSETSESPERVA